MISFSKYYQNLCESVPSESELARLLDKNKTRLRVKQNVIGFTEGNLNYSIKKYDDKIKVSVIDTANGMDASSFVDYKEGTKGYFSLIKYFGVKESVNESDSDKLEDLARKNPGKVITRDFKVMSDIKLKRSEWCWFVSKDYTLIYCIHNTASGKMIVTKGATGTKTVKPTPSMLQHVKCD